MKVKFKGRVFYAHPFETVAMINLKDLLKSRMPRKRVSAVTTPLRRELNFKRTTK